MNRVRAANMALQFAIVPVSAFVTFSVVRHCFLLLQGPALWEYFRVGAFQKQFRYDARMLTLVLW